MHPFKKMIFQSFVATSPGGGGEPIPSTVLGLRSTNGYATTSETNICIEALSVNCRIETQTANQITSGDRMYESNGITPFIGGQGTGRSYSFYNVALSIWTEFEGTRVCYIDSNGFISVDTICTI